MWDQLLSNPATRAYLMRFPPSTWEEKAVEAVQSAVEAKQRTSHTSKQKQASGSGGGSGSGGIGGSSRQGGGRGQRAQTHKSDRSGSRGRTSQSVTSSPTLPAQPITVITATQPPTRTQPTYPLVRPLTPNHPLLTGHERPRTYADEYYCGNPYVTSAAAIGASWQNRDWPHRIGQNERNYSSATLLHHQSHTTAPINDRKGAAATPTADQPMHTALLSTAAQPATTVEERVEEEESEDRRQLVGEEQAAARWRYQQRQGSDITINVQCQHPQHHSQSHKPNSPLPHPPHAYPTPTLLPVATTASPSVRVLPVPPPLPPTSTSLSTPFYSSAQSSRPPLHPSFSHPHSVYPAWWPSEQDRLAEERREEAKRREEERRQRRQAARQREANERVRAVMDHTCPPPPAQAREGVAERKEDRQTEMKRADAERARDVLRLQSDGGSDVNILATHPSSASSTSSSIASVERASRQPVRPHTSHRPSLVAQSTIKPILDRDRRQSAVFDKWGTAPATQSARPASSREAGDATHTPPLAGPSVSSSTHTDYASLIRSLVADPIVNSFAAQSNQPSHRNQSVTQPTPLSSHSSDTSSLPLPSNAARAAMLANAVSVSTAAAAAALDGLDNVSRDTDEDRLAGRLEWDNIAASQAARPFNRQVVRRQWKQQQTGRRNVEIESGSDESDETERLLHGGHM